MGVMMGMIVIGGNVGGDNDYESMMQQRWRHTMVVGGANPFGHIYVNEVYKSDLMHNFSISKSIRSLV